MYRRQGKSDLALFLNHERKKIMALNLCQFMGNLGQDPDIRYLPDGRAVANISIACTDRWKDKQSGEIKENTEWVRAVAFGRRAEVIGEYFKKGNQIYISGKMRTRSYEKDGVKHYTTEIVIDNFDFCGQRSGGGNDARAQQQAAAYGQGGSAKGGNKPPAYDAPPPDYSDFDDDIPF
jgi:single-strand DNA-binding protein